MAALWAQFDTVERRWRRASRECLCVAEENTWKWHAGFPRFHCLRSGVFDILLTSPNATWIANNSENAWHWFLFTAYGG